MKALYLERNLLFAWFWSLNGILPKIKERKDASPTKNNASLSKEK